MPTQQEINLHTQLALAHTELAEIKRVELLRERDRASVLEEQRIQYALVRRELEELKALRVLPLDLPHMKLLRKAGFDYVELLPQDLTSVKGIDTHKSKAILNYLNGKP